MEVRLKLTPDQEAFVRQAVESGRLHDEQEALQEALALWEERERRRQELLASVHSARAAHARGEGRPLTEVSIRELTDQVKARGRARLAAEQSQPQ
jgi:putative addiction module CopG family antidote